MIARTLLHGFAVALFAVAAPQTSDIVIYGCTSGGITAAIQAKRMGKSVQMVCPEKHLGGLTAGGLGFTDTGNKAVIGGLSREFYHRVWQHYDKPEAWTWQKREQFGNRGQGTEALDSVNKTMWIFEPHVAENVFEAWVKETQIPIARNAWLDRKKGVKKQSDRIISITTLDGKTYAGKMFLDATYEGDLMAAAGVDYHVGRESMATYDEKWAGVQTGVLHHRHHFGVLPTPISPYVVPGDPKSGVLPRISTENPGKYGEGDKKLQAYCYRMCLTQVPENRVPFPKPAGYDPKQYELLLRIFNAGWRETFQKFDAIPNAKTDTNNHGPFSTDNIGRNYEYPEASYERRREILREHITYQQGWFYFIANDPRVPEDVRSAMAKWGLAKDEFKDNGNWPHQIYVREARRMIGQYVMTENELVKRRPTPESVGMGSYGIDSHNIQRYITPEGHVQNEGDIGVSTNGPYQISYGSLVPKKGQAANLLVPVCVSSSHIAYGSIRMEPVFMILGQSAATAAAMAIDGGLAVQDVPYAKLRERLVADGQVLEYRRPNEYSAPASAGRPPAPRMVSPEVHSDRRITFRVRAPKASDVVLSFGSQSHKMTKDDQGVWSVTIGPVPPELYTYTFNVDGMRVLDMSNNALKNGRALDASLVEVPGTPARFDEEQNVAHGSIHVRTYEAQALGGRRRKLYVYVPPQYDAEPQRRFPVLVLRHGSGDTEANWSQDGRAGVISDNLLAKQKAVPMLIVMPNGDTDGSWAGGSSAEAMNLLEKETLLDILPFIEKNYRVAPGRENRAIAGLSMGGGQAFTIGLRNLDAFAWVAQFSSGLVSAREFDLAKHLPGFLENAAENNKKLRLLFLSCGTEDVRINGQRNLSDLLRERGIQHVWYETPGGHEWKVWRHSLAELLPKLFQR